MAFDQLAVDTYIILTNMFVLSANEGILWSWVLVSTASMSHQAASTAHPLTHVLGASVDMDLRMTALV